MSLGAIAAVRLDRAARRRPKRKPKPRPIPKNGARRAQSPQPPRAVENFFALALRRMAKRISKAMMRVLGPRLKDFAKPPKEEEKKDAVHLDAERPKGPATKALMKELGGAAKGAIGKKEVKASARTAGARTLKHSENEFDRLGIDVRDEPEMEGVIESWIADVLERIEATLEDEVDDIEDILEDGFGMSLEALTNAIADKVDGVTASRAEFIARDSILTLNSNITQARQTAADIEEYVWTTSLDERVREEHQDLEGAVFSWESGGDPEEGHPGEAPNCRCVAFPILPELGEDDSEEEAD